jgi:hypothetical protein
MNSLSDIAAGTDRSNLISSEGHLLRLLTELPKPEGVKRISWNTGEDSAGNPALWVRFIVSRADDINGDRELLSRIRRSTATIRSGLRETGVAFWPYFEIEAE